MGCALANKSAHMLRPPPSSKETVFTGQDTLCINFQLICSAGLFGNSFYQVTDCADSLTNRRVNWVSPNRVAELYESEKILTPVIRPAL